MHHALQILSYEQEKKRHRSLCSYSVTKVHAGKMGIREKRSKFLGFSCFVASVSGWKVTLHSTGKAIPQWQHLIFRLTFLHRGEWASEHSTEIQRDLYGNEDLFKDWEEPPKGRKHWRDLSGFPTKYTPVPSHTDKNGLLSPFSLHTPPSLSPFSLQVHFISKFKNLEVGTGFRNFRKGTSNYSKMWWLALYGK